MTTVTIQANDTVATLAQKITDAVFGAKGDTKLTLSGKRIPTYFFMKGQDIKGILSDKSLNDALQTVTTLTFNVSAVGSSAFEGAAFSALQTLDFGTTATLEEDAFNSANFSALTQISLGKLRTIPYNAFALTAMSVLKKLDFGTVISIESNAFRSANLHSLTMLTLGTVKKIGDFAFAFSDLRALLKLDTANVETIGRYAFVFAHLDSASSLTFPALKAINDCAFNAADLASAMHITFPPGVVFKGDAIFLDLQDIPEKSDLEQIKNLTAAQLTTFFSVTPKE